MLVVAILGIVNALYLAWAAMMGSAPTCFLNSGCDIVAASPQSRVFGIPLANFGVLFYTMIAGFSLWGFVSREAPAVQYVLPLSALGFLLSLYFLYLQAFVIHAYCEYCLFSLFDATVLFLLALYLWLVRKEQGRIEEQVTETQENHGSL